jgi:hypothetical protein
MRKIKRGRRMRLRWNTNRKRDAQMRNHGSIAGKQRLFLSNAPEGLWGPQVLQWVSEALLLG